MCEIDNHFWSIHNQSPQNALAWLAKLDSRIESLETMPHRCSLIRENKAFDENVRELLHFAHRIIFTVDEMRSLVFVHALRHSAQDELRRNEP